MNSVQAPDRAGRPSPPLNQPDMPGLRLSPYAVQSVLLFMVSVFVSAFSSDALHSNYSSAGISGTFLAFVVLLPLATQIAGIVFGHMGRHQVRDWPTVYRGRWLATVGLIVGYAAVFFWLCFGLLYIGLSSLGTT